VAGVSDVFVSYAHADQRRVDALIRQLQAEQIDVWWDRHLPVGRNWDDELEAAMVTAPTILIVWSAAARASDEVKDEAYFARKLRKALPARLQAVDLPYRLDRIQRVELPEEPVERCPDWPRLVDALRERRGMVFVDVNALRPGPASCARVDGDALHTTWPALCVVAGLAVAGIGQATLGAQAPLALAAGSLLCGGGLMGALMAWRSMK